MTDLTFHFPPELLHLLGDVIPLLNRSKQDVLTFFRGAGVSDALLQDLAQRLRAAPKDIGKYEIARTVLERLNRKGEAGLRDRREVLRRVVEFSNFDACWPAEQLKAKGLVASVREVVNQKDAFTRMNDAREQERRSRIEEAERVAQQRRARLARIHAAKQNLYGLFGSSLSPQERGKRMETALNDLFDAHGLLVRGAFHVVGDPGTGITEQVDGVIEVSGALHFVEMKWYQRPVGKAEIAEHLVRLISRAEARGIFISASDYTEPAIQTARDFLQHKLLTLITLQEIVQVLEREEDLSQFLRRKLDAAQILKDPYLRS